MTVSTSTHNSTHSNSDRPLPPLAPQINPKTLILILQIQVPALGQEEVNPHAQNRNAARQIKRRRRARRVLDRREDLRADRRARLAKARRHAVRHAPDGRGEQLHGHEPDGGAGAHVPERLHEPVEHDKGRDRGRGQGRVAAADDEAEDDIAGPAGHAGPLAADAVAEVGSGDYARDGEEGEDELPDCYCADVVGWDDVVDDC